MAQPVIGIDLGGTNIKAALVGPAGGVLGRAELTTQEHRGPEAVADRICRAARDCAADAGLCLADAAGIGIGSPGTLDLAAGVVLLSPNLPGMREVPLRRLIGERTALPCAMENDANAAALAEAWVGAGRGARSLVLITLGTGIGSGIVLEGRVWHGLGVAGEIGHMCIDPHGPVCACGARGCFEALASATGMVRRLRRAVADGAATGLADRLDDLTAAAIYRAACAGDAVARDVLTETGRLLGVGVTNIIHLLQPHVIAFSGGMAAAGDMLMEPLLAEVEERALAPARRGVRICWSELPRDAGVIGAARAFMMSAD